MVLASPVLPRAREYTTQSPACLTHLCGVVCGTRPFVQLIVLKNYLLLFGRVLYCVYCIVCMSSELLSRCGVTVLVWYGRTMGWGCLLRLVWCLV